MRGMFVYNNSLSLSKWKPLQPTLIHATIRIQQSHLAVLLSGLPTPHVALRKGSRNISLITIVNHAFDSHFKFSIQIWDAKLIRGQVKIILFLSKWSHRSTQSCLTIEPIMLPPSMFESPQLSFPMHKSTSLNLILGPSLAKCVESDPIQSCIFQLGLIPQHYWRWRCNLKSMSAVPGLDNNKHFALHSSMSHVNMFFYCLNFILDIR